MDCTTCPRGFYCSVANKLPIACAAGTYSADGASACTPCAAGTYAIKKTYDGTEALTNVCANCAVGYYSLGSWGSCMLCPAGSACPGGGAVLIPCLAASY